MIKQLIKHLSDTSEFILIISIVFGFYIVQSFYSFLLPPDIIEPVTNLHLIRLLFLELILGVIALYILHLREWNPSQLHLNISLKESGYGVLLWLADNCTFVVFVVLTGALFGNKALSGNTIEYGEIHPGVALIASTISPFLEELFVVGYVVQALEKKHDPFFAISVSAFIRFLYHIYQGPIAAVFIIPMGLLHGYIFWRWKKMWPLIFAHFLMNIVYFLNVK